MEISIVNSELDALAFACAALDDAKYYIIPTSKRNLVKAFIKHRNGKDLTNMEGYYLRSFMNDKIELDKAKAALSECELMQQP